MVGVVEGVAADGCGVDAEEILARLARDPFSSHLVLKRWSVDPQPNPYTFVQSRMLL